MLIAKSATLTPGPTSQSQIHYKRSIDDGIDDDCHGKGFGGGRSNFQTLLLWRRLKGAVMYVYIAARNFNLSLFLYAQPCSLSDDERYGELPGLLARREQWCHWLS